ncbi:MAG: hypothetical protein OHK0011_26840 [Turneriella sp.]
MLVGAVLFQCGSQRDKDLVELYNEGIAYAEQTLHQLKATRSADEAADVAEQALVPLRRLVDRKNQLEIRYPELQNTAEREKIHNAFPEFHRLRAAARELFFYGDRLAGRYKEHPRFRRAVREGFELLSYF